MARQYRSRFKIVTLDGQVMNPGGSMTGGSVAKEAGFLSRANELQAPERPGDCPASSEDDRDRPG